MPVAPPIEIAPVAKGATALLARAITSVGENRAPKFSPDGSKILFLSAARPSHKQTQVYELDLTRMTERRVTFHDGDDEGASWAAAGKITYSSVTDEMKEGRFARQTQSGLRSLESHRNRAKRNSHDPRPTGGDIYLQRLDGRDIERLTSNPGADVSPTANLTATKNPKIVFVSSRDGDPRLYLYDGSSTKPVSRGGDSAPAYAADGKSLAWERSIKSGDAKESAAQTQIVMTENLKSATPLTSPGFIDRSPSWSPKADAVIFSSNRGGKNLDLYLIDRNGSCLKRLTQTTTDLSFPAISPDGTKIAFSSRASGQYQIYLMDNKSADLPCLGSSPAASATPTKP